MKKLLLILALLLPLFSLAQSAVVVQLDDFDSSQARKLYDDFQHAEKKWNDFQEYIDHKYASNEYDAYNTFCTDGTMNCHPADEQKHKAYSRKPQWVYGFEFTEDMKFLVPLRPGRSDNPTIYFRQ
jgi:opacity protein-like surface antigen